MSYTAINLITFVLGLLFLFNGYYLVKNGREDIILFVVSGMIGGGLITVALIPDIFDIIASLLGLELKGRAILVVANLTLFIIVSYLFNQIGRLYDHISQLNEELSLLRNEVEQQNDD